MISLADITEKNWMEAASLSVKDSQSGFLAPAVGILARGYVYRGCRARVFAIENDGVPVGLALVREFTDEPLGYDLQQFMIDARYQGRGYGSAALGLLLDELRRDGRFDRVEVCVKKQDDAAIRLYEKHGFTDTGYVDEDVPDAVNMVCRLYDADSRIAVLKVDRNSWLADRLLEYVRNCSWEGVKDHIAGMIEKWEFSDWETMFAAVADGRIVGMAAALKTDYYPLPDVFPWVSCIFVSEEYRGRRISGDLIACANRYLKGLGFSRSYIPTEFTGLYEHYGYRYLRDIVNYGGDTDRLYVKEINVE